MNSVQLKSRSLKTAGAIQVQTYIIIQIHDDDIFTHILGSFAVKLRKSDAGLKRVKTEYRIKETKIFNLLVPVCQNHHNV